MSAKKLKINKKAVLMLLIQLLIIMIGTFVMSFAYKVFLSPYKIVPGGFMGLAQIINEMLAGAGFTALSTSIIYIILNAFLFIYAVIVLGAKFGIRAGVGILSYSFFVALLGRLDFISQIGLQFESESASLGGGFYIMYAIFGGLIMGIGMGIVFRADGSTGGSDMIAVVMNTIFPTVTIGQIIICVNGLVVVLSAIAYHSLVLPLYALIAIFLSGKISDVFIDGVKSVRAYYILTTKKDEMAQKIMAELKRGATNIHCEGMFTHSEKDMLLVLIKKSQVLTIKKVIKSVDPKAFTFSHSIKEAYGNGFLAFKPPEYELKKIINSKFSKKNKKAEKVANEEENITKE